MRSPPTDSCFKAVAGFAVLIASLTPLDYQGAKQAAANSYSHGTTACFEENDTVGIKVLLTQKDRCGVDLHPYLEIDIREAPVAVRKEIVIGPDNWAFSCPSAKEPCEQIPSGRVVFDHLEGQTAGLKTEGHYELRTRRDTVEKGSFRVDCVAACMP